MFRLRGGGVNGDLAGVPNARLAVLPGTTHIGVMFQTELLLAILPPFLDAATDAPVPEDVMHDRELSCGGRRGRLPAAKDRPPIAAWG